MLTIAVATVLYVLYTWNSLTHRSRESLGKVGPT